MSTFTMTTLGKDLKPYFAVSNYPFYLYCLHQPLLEVRHIDYFWQESGIIAHLLLQILIFQENGEYLCLAS